MDPNNEALSHLKAEINQRAAEQLGRVPSQEALNSIPAIKQEKITIATRIRDAKLYYEMGKLEQAQGILNEVMKEDPANATSGLLPESDQGSPVHESGVANRRPLPNWLFLTSEKSWITPRQTRQPGDSESHSHQWTRLHDAGTARDSFQAGSHSPQRSAVRFAFDRSFEPAPNRIPKARSKWPGN